MAAKLRDDPNATGNVNVSTWNLEALEKIGTLIAEAANEALTLAVKDRADIFSPYLERGEGDPLELQLEIPLGESQDIPNPSWVFSLKDAIEFFLSGVTRDNKIIDGEDIGRAVSFARSLRKLADEIESYI